MTLASPANIVAVANRQTKSVRAHVSANPSVEGSNQFRKKSFQIHLWLLAKIDRVTNCHEHAKEDVNAGNKMEDRREDLTEQSAEARCEEPSHQPDEDIEAHSKFDNRCVEPS